MGPHDRINGGYFVVEPAIFDHLTGDDCVFETGPLSSLARAGNWPPTSTMDSGWRWTPCVSATC